MKKSTTIYCDNCHKRTFDVFLNNGGHVSIGCPDCGALVSLPGNEIVTNGKSLLKKLSRVFTACVTHRQSMDR